MTIEHSAHVVVGTHPDTKTMETKTMPVDLPTTARLDSKGFSVKSLDEAQVETWTETEENKARRKIDFILLPLLAISMFCLTMDRSNMGNALTSTILVDLKITQDWVNVGTQLLAAGIVILEIPSNIVLQKIGPRYWLPGQVIAWGLVATFQAFINNLGSFLATRLLLGLMEAGFIPGSLYVLSTWYKKGETSLRVSLFFIGSQLASATASLVAAGILTMSGRNGVAGWRWLFLIEGIITIGIGIILLLFIPPSPERPQPLITGRKKSYWTPRESNILSNRVILDDPNKLKGAISISGRDILNTLSTPRIWLHVLITTIGQVASAALQLYTPSIIKGLGFSVVKANALSSIGVYAGAVFLLLLAWLSDKTKLRGPWVLLASTWGVIIYSITMANVSSTDQWRKFAIVTCCNVSFSVPHILNTAWCSSNCRSPQERSIALAMIIMGANAASIAGAQIFRAADAPLYRTAFTSIMAVSAVGWLVCLALMLYYRRLNTHLLKSSDADVVRMEDGRDERCRDDRDREVGAGAGGIGNGNGNGSREETRYVRLFTL